MLCSNERRQALTRGFCRCCRLNYRLSVACEQDVEALCAQECHPAMGQSCGGRVLRCLTEKQDQLSSQSCRDEVFYFEKMEVNDYRNDVILAEACRTDVDKYCKTVPRGMCRPLPALCMMPCSVLAFVGCVCGSGVLWSPAAHGH